VFASLANGTNSAGDPVTCDADRQRRDDYRGPACLGRIEWNLGDLVCQPEGVIPAAPLCRDRPAIPSTGKGAGIFLELPQ
jgi:hypothetical protein